MKKNIAFLIIICFAISLNSMAQTRIRVNNTPNVDADYSDLQEAIDAASAGDVIYIEGTGIPHSGTYHVNKAYLTLIGPGYFLALNDSTQSNTAPAIIQELWLDEAATGAIVMGMKITGSLNVNASSTKVSRNHLYQVELAKSNTMADLSLFQNYITYEIGSGSYNSTASIYNNIITSSTRPIVTNDHAVLNIYNNIISGGYPGPNWVVVENSFIKNNIIYTTYAVNYRFIDPSPTHNNSIYNNVICQEELTEFPNNVWDVTPEDVAFYNEGGPEGKYVLIDESPAIGAGENGVDCGIFGGNTPYVFSGLPPIPHIFESNIPFSGSSSDGLPVHIKAKTQQ